MAVNSVKKEKLAEVEAEEDVRVWSNLFRSDFIKHFIFRFIASKKTPNHDVILNIHKVMYQILSRKYYS